MQATTKDTAMEEAETDGNVGLIVLVICGLLIFFVMVLFAVIWYIKRARRRYEQETYKRSGEVIHSTTNGLSTISQQTSNSPQNENNAKTIEEKENGSQHDSDQDVIQGMGATAGGDMQTNGKEEEEEESTTDSDYDSQAPKNKHGVAESSDLQFQDTFDVDEVLQQ
mmetsp:Transcript_11852/g.19094  ORF Transcript_11852/g.19094 Transcript_11852/m.19094 type:complete len:167 (+) Transcript_11852:111-611(+)|eukprot:CAMPEP_0197077536 /NCGR_PEP_ID=MMETSP1384-20130603/212672_1 /TAXON_ID=29189 /ORGANISM="Ammonia sp." /LENGTH=166 /DNA_ID=CAMNT_0042516401 /DNA_START=676 /DNA_END=1176 /DNA_ORIENTATION=-